MQTRPICNRETYPGGTFRGDSVMMIPSSPITGIYSFHQPLTEVSGFAVGSQMWAGRAGAPRSPTESLRPVASVQLHNTWCSVTATPTASVDGRPGCLRDATGQTDVSSHQEIGRCHAGLAVRNIVTTIPYLWYLKRSEERRVGKECLRLCRSRWSPYH